MRDAAFVVVCLLYAGSTAAAPPCDQNWRTDRHATMPGIVLETNIDDFEVGQPAPSEVLEKLGPVLCAAGTEELRVRNVHRQPPLADPARYAQRTLRFEQLLRGREVWLGHVSISMNIETHEVLEISANFLPDRGIDHLPRLPPGQAKAMATAGMRQAMLEKIGPGERSFSFHDHPAHLAYDIEEAGFAPVRGILVWVFDAYIDPGGWFQIHVDATTGRIMSIIGFFEF